jgi:hypothetical protein
MKLGQPPTVRKPRGKEIDFAFQKTQVGRCLVLVRADDHVTTAEKTSMFAEREMNIDRKGIVAEQIAFGETVFVLGNVYVFVEFNRSRIARVPRTRTVISRQEFRRDSE